MSQGKPGNIFSTLIKRILIPGLKRSRGLADKREAGRSSSL